MPSLLEIKKQIGGIKNTRKITKAMQLVAASKARSFQEKALSIREFALELLYILDHNHQSIAESALAQSPKGADQVLFVLYSSDKGLCGALNNHLNKALLGCNAWNDTPKDKRKLITIGRKATNFATFNKLNAVETIEGVSEKLTAFEALEHTEQILKEWNTGKYSHVYMVAPHFKNTFTSYSIVKQFLPASSDTLKAHIGVDADSFHKELPKKRENNFMLYEPSKTEVADRIVDDLVHTLFLQAFYELKAAEYGSRMIAMQNATDSADKLIDEKTTIYNKARQAAITQEIAEIVSGSSVEVK